MLIWAHTHLFVRSQIYTDWANYYLERAKSKKRVADLSGDFRDGLLLADVIEAVTAFKVPDLAKKPKTKQQMVSVPDEGMRCRGVRRLTGSPREYGNICETCCLLV